MKKIISIFLLFIFLYNLCGYYLVFKVAQYEVRREVKKKLKQSVPEAELILIKVTPDQGNHLKWIKENEFRFEGRLFDVVKQENILGTIHYWCINDEQEEKLFADLDDHIKNYISNHDTDIPGHTKGKVKKITDDYLVFDLISFLPDNSVYYTCFSHPYHLYHIQPEIFTPPPEKV